MCRLRVGGLVLTMVGHEFICIGLRRSVLGTEFRSDVSVFDTSCLSGRIAGGFVVITRGLLCEACINLI